MSQTIAPFDNDNMNESTRSKRPRSSLACIRCRKKKVKCDFLQPVCGRCHTSGLACSYATPPRRVDGQAFDQLGNNVEAVKARMRQMQSELIMLKNNLQPTVYHPSVNQHGSTPFGNGMTGDHHVTWKLTLSPTGLRIDTNIASVDDLYRILLNGISQLNINKDSHGHLSSADGIQRSKPLKSIGNVYRDTSTTRQLWEVDHHAPLSPIKQARPLVTHNTALDEDTMAHLVRNYYDSCFLAYQIVDQDEFALQCKSTSKSDLLLINSISAWMSKHSCIYHQCDNTKDFKTVGEAYFVKAQQLLKARFDISSSITIQALLNMYMYQLNCERSTLAYLYIGLAIRMAQDLKLHKKAYMVADPILREKNKRLWWSAYWLDLCAALESNRPTMVDDKDCNIDYPSKMDYEDELTGYQIDFTVSSIKLMKIRKEITRHLPSEQAGQKLLSAISRLELTLMDWLQNLPAAIKYDIDEDSGDPVFRKKGDFCDEACLILNIQYHTSWIMLHKGFLPRPGQAAAPVALLSQNICTKGANFITRLVQIYSQNLSWCHFFYTLEGIVTSVNIHKVNVSSPEQEVSENAKYNLLVTSNILKSSPLVYLEKVTDIIESIRIILKDHNYHPDLLSSLPGPSFSKEKVNKTHVSTKASPLQQNIIPLHQPVYLQQYHAYNHSSGSESSPAASVTCHDSPDHHKGHVLFTQPHQQHTQQQHQHPLVPIITSTAPAHHRPALSESILRQHQQHDFTPFGSGGIVLNDPTSSLMDLNLRHPPTSHTNNGRDNFNSLMYADMNFDMVESDQFYSHTMVSNSRSAFIGNPSFDGLQQPHELTNYINNNHHDASIYLHSPNQSPFPPPQQQQARKRNDRDWEHP